MEKENILRQETGGSSHANYRWSTALSCKRSCVISNFVVACFCAWQQHCSDVQNLSWARRRAEAQSVSITSFLLPDGFRRGGCACSTEHGELRGSSWSTVPTANSITGLLSSTLVFCLKLQWHLDVGILCGRGLPALKYL